jgi:hypothetical protein
MVSCLFPAGAPERALAGTAPPARDLSASAEAVITMRSPKGFAFAISDLILARGWATFHNPTMVVRVDHGSEDEEYEEVIELGWGTRSRAHFILWTNSEAVFVQPMPGKMHRHASLAEALESLPVQHAMVLTDIAATVWPAD